MQYYILSSINIVVVVKENVRMKVLKGRWELGGEHKGRGCRRKDKKGESSCTFKSQSHCSLAV